MGSRMSRLYEQNPVNYDCPKCKESGKTPNKGGRFHLINDTECQCNGCKSIYAKELFYKPVVTNATELKEPAV